MSEKSGHIQLWKAHALARVPDRRSKPDGKHGDSRKASATLPHVKAEATEPHSSPRAPAPKYATAYTCYVKDDPRFTMCCKASFAARLHNRRADFVGLAKQKAKPLAKPPAKPLANPKNLAPLSRRAAQEVQQQHHRTDASNPGILASTLLVFGMKRCF